MSTRKFRYCPICRTELVPGRHGGRERPACPACSFVHWGNPVPVVGAIVERDGHVLMVRSHGWPPTWYGLVTGFLEPAERPEEATLREVKEELGLDAELVSFLGAYPFERMNQIILTYHVVAGPGEVRLCEEELADWKAVPFGKLRPWNRGTGPALGAWLASRGFHPPMVEFGQHIAD